MLAMTTATKRGIRDEEEHNAEVEEGAAPPLPEDRMPLSSGLSALIQAATAHLAQFVEETTGTTTSKSSSLAVERKHQAQIHYQHHGGGELDYGTHSDDCMSHEDLVESTCPASATAVNRTPTIVPELDLRKQSFPEVLMTLASDVENADIITFLPDGKFFAIRSADFAAGLMLHYFEVRTFDEFLDLLSDWGFSRILQESNCTGVEVFRHPQFIKGHWEMCGRIKFGESPTTVRVSALPDRGRIEHSLSDDSGSQAGPATCSNNTKRRLSPSFLARRESQSSVTSKQRLDTHEDSSMNLLVPSLGVGGTTLEERTTATDMMTRREGRANSIGCDDSVGRGTGAICSDCRTDDLRSVALAITTEKMNLRGQDPSLRGETGISSIQCNMKKTPLVDTAVENATHTIVTDAIETLLRDENHTKETYLKHEEELSRSSLPGLIPISKQLFSPPTHRTNHDSMTTATFDSNHSNKLMSPPPAAVVTTTTKAPSRKKPPQQRQQDNGESSLETSPETSPKATSLPEPATATAPASHVPSTMAS